MLNSESTDLENVKQLCNKCKYEEALQNIKHIEKYKTLNSKESLETRYYKCFIALGLGQFDNALKIAEALYQKSQELEMPLYSVDALYIKQWVFFILLNLEEWYKNYEQFVKLFSSIPQEESPEFQEREARLLICKSWANYFKGNFDLALDYGNKSLKLLKQVDSDSWWIPSVLGLMGAAYSSKGELNYALEFHEKALSLKPNEEYYFPMISRALTIYNIGVCYLGKGDLSIAIEYFIKALEIYKKFNKTWIMTSWAFFFIIYSLILQDNYDRAKNYLQQFKQYNEEDNSWFGHLIYQFSYALILKSSSRLHDRVEAENILKKIIKENKRIDVTTGALKHLCNWYFEEFQLSHQMDILDDIKPLIENLQKNAKLQNSYSLSANVKLLQAKLALLQINMVGARKLLTEAQKIADEHGLQLLAGEISKEHDNLLEELKLWESFKKEQESVAERLKLASIDPIMARLQGRRAIEIPEVNIEEPILLIIMDKSGASYFNHSFVGEWDFDDLFSSFMSAFNAFSGEIFSRSIDRIKIGENTILINPIEPYLACYIIKGQSYPAQQKLTRFSDTIKATTEIWDALNRAAKTSEMLELDNPPSLGSTVNEIFI